MQEGYLRKEYEIGLDGQFAFRADADQMEFGRNNGETFSNTRMGRKGPKTTPLVPSAVNGDINNGLTLSTAGAERYTFTLRDYSDGIPLNLRMDKTKIKGQFLDNGRINSTQGAQTLEHLARNCWQKAYLGGDTRVVSANGTNTTTKYYVDDIRGFQQVLVNGVPTDTSPSNPLTAYATGSTSATLSVTGATADTVNVSTNACGGISGFLTLGGAVTLADGDRILAIDAPKVLRAGGRATTAQLQSRDVNTLGLIQDAKTHLKKQGAPRFPDGTYHWIGPDDSIRQLFDDPKFLSIYQTAHSSKEWQAGEVFQLLGVTFFPTTEAQDQPAVTGGSGAQNVAQRVLRPILVAAGGIIQANFADNDSWLEEIGGSKVANMEMVGDICHIVRAPIDVLQVNITQAWLWGGDFCCPTDATTTTSTIPTAGAHRYKRAVQMEHAA